MQTGCKTNGQKYRHERADGQQRRLTDTHMHGMQTRKDTDMHPNYTNNWQLPQEHHDPVRVVLAALDERQTHANGKSGAAKSFDRADNQVAGWQGPPCRRKSE